MYKVTAETIINTVCPLSRAQSCNPALSLIGSPPHLIFLKAQDMHLGVKKHVCKRHEKTYKMPYTTCEEWSGDSWPRDNPGSALLAWVGSWRKPAAHPQKPPSLWDGHGDLPSLTAAKLV